MVRDPARWCFSLFYLQCRSLHLTARRLWLVFWPPTEGGDTPASLREGQPAEGGPLRPGLSHSASSHAKRHQNVSLALVEQETHKKILPYVDNLVHLQTKPRKEIEVWCHLTPALGFALRVKSPPKIYSASPTNPREVKGPHLVIFHPTGPSLQLPTLHSPIPNHANSENPTESHGLLFFYPNHFPLRTLFEV